MSIFDEYRRSGVKTRIGVSGFITGRGKGKTLELANLLPAIAGAGLTIDLDGDFTTENGPTYSDAPWTPGFFASGYFYHGKLTRRMLTGTVVGLVDAGVSQPIYVDRLEIIVGKKYGDALPEINNSGTGYKHAQWMKDYTPSKFVWERHTTYVSVNGYQSQHTLTSWNLVHEDNRWIPVGLNTSGLYLIDPMLGSDFHIQNYNPANPIQISSSVNYTCRNHPVTITVAASASGTPTFSGFAGSPYTPTWVKPFSVENGKLSKIILDFTGHDNMFVFGVTPSS